MTLTPELIAFYKNALTNPKENELAFPSISEVFEPADTAIAKDVAYGYYLGAVERSTSQIPKIVFYIVMDELFQQGLTDNSEMGYLIKDV